MFIGKSQGRFKDTPAPLWVSLAVLFPRRSFIVVGEAADSSRVDVRYHASAMVRRTAGSRPKETSWEVRSLMEPIYRLGP